jgi:hypothetical protein
MADLKGKQICEEFGREQGKQGNTRDLWQRTGDTMWPYIQVNSRYEPGEVRTRHIYDMTPTLDMLDMVSGFKQVLMPAGQTFYVINPQGYQPSDDAMRYLSYLTNASHEKLFASNLSIALDPVLISLITFGPGGLFTEFNYKKGLNYKAPKIGSYVLIEDDSENVIGSIHEMKITASNAYHLWGEKAGKMISEAMTNEKKVHEEFEFLYKVCPRDRVNPFISKSVNTNMPYMSVIVNKKEQCTVEEGGFHENPYSFARWMRPEYEKDGRGIGTEMLPQIKVLQQMAKDYRDCGNRWNHPPRQGLIDSIEGQVDNRPDAMNWVTQIDAIRSLDNDLKGHFPYTEKSLQDQREIIDRAFFKNAFDPLADLKGDRRTTLEIQERIRGTLKKLGPPVGRVWHELMSPVITRSVLELIRNRVVEPPPDELSGAGFGIEYIGPLALALKSEQARGLQEWLNFVGQANAQFPDQYISDNVDFDEAVPRIGRTFGVNVDDIATSEERDKKRALRQQAIQEQKQLQQAEMASRAYQAGSKEAEPGSPAEALMGQMG